MALKDQPYLPLYVQDVMTDEKLAFCSAESHGVYFRLICFLHKQQDYGKILLKQKFKQNGSKYENFAAMLAKVFPFDLATILRSLIELEQEQVIQISPDCLSQKRMVNDGILSEIRSKAAKKGANVKKSAKNFAIAKQEANTQANSEYESESENEVESVSKSNKGESTERGAKSKRFVKPKPEEVEIYMQAIDYPATDFRNEAELFIDHYSSKGWKIGKSPMKDWKACVRTWKKRRSDDPIQSKTSKGHNVSEDTWTKAEQSFN